jgi:predicted RNA methylase
VVPNQLVPSEKKEKMSFLAAVAVSVGGVAEGQDTVDQVTVNPPFCVRIMMNDLPATAVGIVIVALAVNVRF